MSASTGRNPTYQPVAEWDREMPREEVFKLSPRDKRARVAISLARKVDEAAAAAADRPGTGLQGLPGNLAALRRRNDAARGMYVLRTPEAKRHPENAQEIQRWKAAILVLVGPKPRGAVSPEERVVELEAEKDALRRQVALLVKELATRAPSLDQARR